MGKVANSFSFGKFIKYTFLIILSLYFFLPMLAIARFAFQVTPVFNLNIHNLFQGWTLEALWIALTDSGTIATTQLSLLLALLTILLSFIVLVPLATYVEIFAQHLKPALTGITLLPWIVPPMALVVGVASTFRQTVPWFLSSSLSLVPFYVLWTLPFSYRALDSGLRMMGARAQYEAATILGASWNKFFWRVILPNLRTAILVTAVLSFSLVLGEFTFASLLLKQTLPTYLVVIQGSQPRAGLALAMVIMVISTLLLSLLVGFLRKRGVQFNAAGI